MAVIAVGTVIAEIMAGVAALYGISQTDWDKVYKQIENKIDPTNSWKNPIEKRKTSTEEKKDSMNTVQNSMYGNNNGWKDTLKNIPLVVPINSGNENTETEQNITTFDVSTFQKQQEELLQQKIDYENSAYQRAMADARKAGINPNLYNVQPASSNAYDEISKMTTDQLTEYIAGNISLIEQEIGNEFTGDQNTWKNIVNVGTGLLAGLIYILPKLIKK